MNRFVLITGASGQLGSELVRARWPTGWRPVGLGRDRLDLSDPDALTEIVAKGHGGVRWTAVINTGAYTAVDKAECDVLAAWQVNALAPAALATACAAHEVPLVQISTDYVFSGDKPKPYEVSDPAEPLGVYGASKLAGELAVRTAGGRHVIIRTAWLVSAFGTNFVKTMLRLAAERDALGVVDDQRGCPSSAADLATAITTIVVRLVEDRAAPTGTFHFSNSGETSWADFAREIFRQSALRGGPTARVEPIETADYPTPARRPANSTLRHSAIVTAYGTQPRPWQEALNDILDELIGVIM